MNKMKIKFYLAMQNFGYMHININIQRMRNRKF